MHQIVTFTDMYAGKAVQGPLCRTEDIRTMSREAHKEGEVYYSIINITIAIDNLVDTANILFVQLFAIDLKNWNTLNNFRV